MMKKVYLPMVATALSIAMGSAHAAVNLDEAALQRLIGQVETLTNRVNQLEKTDKELREENVALREVANSGIGKINEKLAWAEKIKVNGDFRYRYENIDDEKKPSDRNRSRVRARIVAQAQVTDTWKVGLGLASGGNDPVSTNQSLGGGGSSKGINLDLAYFDWSGLENTHVIGGKFKNPFYKPAKNGLIWDGDYRPEGLAVKYDNGTVFANAAYLYLESDDKAGSQDEESYWGAQFGFTTALSDSTQLIAGTSYYHIPVMGSKPFFDDGDSFGNSVVMVSGDEVYLNNYEELEVFAELKTKLGGLPASMFVDWVQNQDADDNDTGWSAGAKLGKAKKPGSWQVAYIYQDLEADAVLGLTTDSDFGGGGSGSKGHIVKGAYALDKNTSLALTYFINDKGALETDYDRLQVDLKFKY
ncbi:MAG: putative porin [Porticoccaceae bacterium]